MLLERAEIPVESAIDRLVGMQAQSPLQPYSALWSRLTDFDPNHLSRLLIDRKVVRISLMRSTIHLVTARDALDFRPLFGLMNERMLRSQVGRQLNGVDFETAIASGRTFVDEKPRTFAEIGTHLQQQWPEADRLALANLIRSAVALVQVPPRGVWGSGGLARHTSVEAWLEAELNPSPSLEQMVLRYLSVFGPATVNDIQTWSGLTRLAEVVNGLRPQLRTFLNEQGKELLDVVDGLLPDPETPVPVRFLPEYDNALIGYADRSRTGSAKYGPFFVKPDGIFRSNLLIDGFLLGTWTLNRDRKSATLVIEPFEKVSRKTRSDLAEEGEHLLAFLAADASTRDLRFDLPD
jgi:hypothetical protein